MDNLNDTDPNPNEGPEGLNASEQKGKGLVGRITGFLSRNNGGGKQADPESQFTEETAGLGIGGQAVSDDTKEEVPPGGGVETPTEEGGATPTEAGGTPAVTPEDIEKFNKDHNVDVPYVLNTGRPGHYDPEEGKWVNDDGPPEENVNKPQTETPTEEGEEVKTETEVSTEAEGTPTEEGEEVKTETEVPDNTKEEVVPEEAPKDPLMDHMSKLGMAFAQTAAEMGGQLAGKGWDMADQLVKAMLTRPHAMSSSSRMIGVALNGLQTAGDLADRAAEKYKVNVNADPKLVEDTIRYRLYQSQCRQADGVVGNTFRAISDSLGGLGVDDVSQLDEGQFHRHVQDMREEKQRLTDLLAKDRAARAKGADGVVDQDNPDRLTGQQRSLVMGQMKHLEGYLNGLAEQGRTMAADSREYSRRAKAAMRQSRQMDQRRLADGRANPYRQVLEWADPNANWELDQKTGMPTKAGAYTAMLRELRGRKTQEISRNGGRPLDPEREKWYQSMDTRINRHKMLVEKEAREAPLREYGDLFVGISSVAPGIGRSIKQIIQSGDWPSSQPLRAIRAYLSDYIKKNIKDTPERRHAQALLLSLDLSTRTRAIRTRLGSVNARQCAVAMNHHNAVGDKWAGVDLDAVEAQKDEVQLARAYTALNSLLPRSWNKGQGFDPNDPSFLEALHNYEGKMNEYLDKWFPLRDRSRDQGVPGDLEDLGGTLIPGETVAPKKRRSSRARKKKIAGPEETGGGQVPPAVGGGQVPPAPVTPPADPGADEKRVNQAEAELRRLLSDKTLIVDGKVLPSLKPEERVAEFKKLLGDDVFDVNEFGRFETNEARQRAYDALREYYGDEVLKDMASAMREFMDKLKPDPEKDAKARFKKATSEQLRALLVEGGAEFDENGRLTPESYKKACEELKRWGIKEYAYTRAMRDAGLNPVSKEKSDNNPPKVSVVDPVVEDAAETAVETPEEQVKEEGGEDVTDPPAETAVETPEEQVKEEGGEDVTDPPAETAGPENDYGITYDMFNRDWGVDGSTEGGRRFIDNIFSDLSSDDWKSRENAYFSLKSSCNLTPEVEARIREQMAEKDSSDALFELAIGWKDSNDPKRYVDSIIAMALADGIFGPDKLDAEPIENAFKNTEGAADAYTPEERAAIIKELGTIVNDPTKCTQVYEMFKTSALGGDGPHIDVDEPEEQSDETVHNNGPEDIEKEGESVQVDDKEVINGLLQGKKLGEQMKFNQFLESLKKQQKTPDRESLGQLRSDVSNTPSYQMPKDMKDYLLTRIDAMMLLVDEGGRVSETSVTEDDSSEVKVDDSSEVEVDDTSEVNVDDTSEVNVDNPSVVKPHLPPVPKLFDDKGRGEMTSEGIKGIKNFVTAFNNLPHKDKKDVIKDIEEYNIQMELWLDKSKVLWSDEDLLRENLENKKKSYMKEAEKKAQNAKEEYARNAKQRYDEKLQKYGENGISPNKGQVTKAKNKYKKDTSQENLDGVYSTNLDSFKKDAEKEYAKLVEEQTDIARKNLEMVNSIGELWYTAMNDVLREDPYDPKALDTSKDFDVTGSELNDQEATSHRGGENPDAATVDENGIWSPSENKEDWTKGDWETWLSEISAEGMDEEAVKEFRQALHDYVLYDDRLKWDMNNLADIKVTETRYESEIRDAFGDMDEETFNDLVYDITNGDGVDALTALAKDVDAEHRGAFAKLLSEVMRDQGSKEYEIEEKLNERGLEVPVMKSFRDMMRERNPDWE